jgi:hypothetical protein
MFSFVLKGKDRDRGLQSHARKLILPSRKFQNLVTYSASEGVPQIGQSARLLTPITRFSP